MRKIFILAATAALTLTGNVAAQDGKAIYERACQVCHAAGIAGAPKIGDAAAWEPRMSQGIDAMVNVVKTGKGAMPPGGMCIGCSDEEIKVAIEYMVK